MVDGCSAVILLRLPSTMPWAGSSGGLRFELFTRDWVVATQPLYAGEPMLRLTLAAIHLLALGIGLGAVWARARALRNRLDAIALSQVFYADTWWGVAGLLWIVTGLTRVFGGFEKGTDYYLSNHLFWAKMGLLALVLVLEIGPMVVLIRWRIDVKRGQDPDTRMARRLARVSAVQAVIVMIMILAATAVARGYGTPGAS